MKTVTFREYVTAVLKNAIYERGESSDAVIAEAPNLPGCFTQGKNFEEARENLIDAIELWVTVGLKKGEEIPVVNGCGMMQTEGYKKQGRTAVRPYRYNSPKSFSRKL